MKKDIVMVILAAGIGKRFWPLETDKNLFPFLGTSMFDLTIPSSLPTQVTECVIVANPKNRTYFQNLKLSVPYSVVIQEKSNGMAGAVIAAGPIISGRSIVIVIADDIADPGLLPTMLAAARPDMMGVLTAWKTTSYFPGGYIVFREDRPIGIREKPGEGKTPSDYVYFGGQYIRDADVLLSIITSLGADSDDVYEQALSRLMTEHRFALIPYDRQFVSLKYPWHVLDVMQYALAHRLQPGRGKNVDIRNNVSLEGAIYIGNNVKIFENTKISGPTYIGDNTVIGSNNIVRESMIGANSVTGFNTDIARSYIGDNCWFHSTYIGDSVLEGNVSMGSGSVLANFRLDEGEIGDTNRTKLGAMIARDVRIGVNTSIMPGVKIGTNSLIGAGLVIDQDIPENSFCTGKTLIEIKKNTRKVTSQRAMYKAKL